MKRRINAIFGVMTFAGALAFAGVAYATPTTSFWTAASSDIQPFGVVHLGIDNYFTVGKKGERGDLPTDVGLTVGVLPYEKLQLEVGIDIFEPTTDPLYFNAKLGTPEGSLFEGSPALNLGVFNVGTDSKPASEDGDGRTDYNIVDFIIGKTLPSGLGRIHAGVYYGNSSALVDRNGEKENAGWMVGWDKSFGPKDDGQGEYNKWQVIVDYASGKNAIGGGGIGVAHYFTKNISLLTGPVWFNEPAVAGPNAGANWVWSTQLDINI
jgi:hypothetical protein